MLKIIRFIFFVFIIKPLVFIFLGLNIHHRERLPKKGPAIIVANHNSHLDTAIIMSLFPFSKLPYLRPVAAADYFLRNRFIAWFSQNVIGILPIARKRSGGVDPFENIHKALANNAIVIFYPEGTRGEPMQLKKIKSGIAYLASEHPDIDIVPLFINGTGKALPKGEALLVPFIADIFIHQAIRWNGEKDKFIQSLEQIFAEHTEQIVQKNYA